MAAPKRLLQARAPLSGQAVYLPSLHRLTTTTRAAVRLVTARVARKSRQAAVRTIARSGTTLPVPVRVKTTTMIRSAASDSR
jgi:hypothetical protein